jgi:hypothetical protein
MKLLSIVKNREPGIHVLHFIDDSYLIQEINLQNPDPSPTERALKLISEVAERKEMKFNMNKTKFMLIQPERSPTTSSFHVHFQQSSTASKDFQSEMKILGCIVTDNLNPEAHIMKNVQSARIRIRLLKRLRELNLAEEHSKKVYTSLIRSRLEFGMAPIARMISSKSIAAAERVQKICLKIMLGDQSYNNLLKSSGLERMNTRFEMLFHNLVQSLGKSGMAGTWVGPESEDGDRVLRRRAKLQPKRCKTTRAQMTPLNVLRNANAYWTPNRQKFKSRLALF